MKQHGFAGHLAEPDGGSDRAVIIIMGGEQSLLPGIKFAERFADHGITGLAVSLFGADGLPENVDRIPLEMFIKAADHLRSVKKISHISIYGQSMGSIFAVLAAQYVTNVDGLIIISPTHVPFEGVSKDKKTMSGHSIVTYNGEEFPFVKADFGKVRVSKYMTHAEAKCRVTGMWKAYYDAYQDKEREQKAWLPIEKTGARILMIAGDEDEMWPAEYSVNVLKKYLEEKGYKNEVKVLIYPHGSHLNGLMPNREREKKLYRMIPLIGLMYKTFGKYRKLNMSYFEQSEREILNWINKV